VFRLPDREQSLSLSCRFYNLGGNLLVVGKLRHLQTLLSESGTAASA
jgi:hypothetical protein